ncbi:uncharacterized protein LOC123528629 [Mercenaria mercenaria]|uniref:uncharacterized protein LOC123528629 n=1 Tax=Mercenaria mercenaria TaxID=6596 RepID=UPI00234E6D8E|nr:uncharacterized protein LOC123528629 [Mercenaria mercenaria]
MRYLAICCVLMLAIALAHTIPSQRIQGLRSLAKTKRNFGVQNTLINRLRDLKTTKLSRHLHTLRQENSESSEDTEPDCKDVCDFGLLWEFGENFNEQLDYSINCGLDKIESMENEFDEDYKKGMYELFQTCIFLCSARNFS